MECCICLKDYLDGADRIQNQTDLEAEIEVVEENLEEILDGVTSHIMGKKKKLTAMASITQRL